MNKCPWGREQEEGNTATPPPLFMHRERKVPSSAGPLGEQAQRWHRALQVQQKRCKTCSFSLSALHSGDSDGYTAWTSWDLIKDVENKWILLHPLSAGSLEIERAREKRSFWDH